MWLQKQPSETPTAQVFSCEFCEISKNTFFTEHLWWLLLWLLIKYVNTITTECLAIIKSLYAILLKIQYPIEQNLLLLTTLKL